MSEAPGNPTPLTVKHGSLHGGAQPIVGATIQLYAVGTTGDGSAAMPLLTQSVISDENGDFTITGDYMCPTAGALVYLTGTGGNPGLPQGQTNNALALMSALGPCGNLTPSTFIYVNEATTVAAVWGLSPFMSSYSNVGSSTTDAGLLANGFTLASYYANVATGTVPGLNVPVGTTVPVAQINTLANILTSCANSGGGVAGDGSNCGTLFGATTPVGGTAPKDVIAAALSMAQNPTLNLSTLFNLVPASPPYQPTLSVAPADLTVSLTTMGLAISPAALTFAPGYVGFASASQAVTITNTAMRPFAFNNISIAGANASDFSISADGCVQNITANATCTIQIVFTAGAVGARNATLAIDSNAANSPQFIALSGSGQAGVGSPVTLSPSPLSFTQAGVPQNVTVTNNGSTPVLVGNASGPGLTVLANNCGAALAAQSICTVSVQANAVGATVQTGTFSVINSSVTPVVSIPFQIAVSADSGISFTAETVDFGSWAVGLISNPITLTNVGSGSNPIGSLIVGPNAIDFSFVNIPPYSPGYSCYATVCLAYVVFRPTGTGLRTTTIQTALGDVQLTGTGIPAGPSFALSVLTPFSPATGNISETLTVTDNGTTPVSFGSPVITGADAGDFTATNPCPSFGSGGYCSMQVNFTPSQSGVRTATLTMTDMNSGVSHSIPLSVNQGALAPSVTPSTIMFSNVDVGSSGSQILTINAGGDPVNLSLVGSSKDFALSALRCSQTPCQVTLTWTPSITGSDNGLVTLVDSYSNTSTYINVIGLWRAGEGESVAHIAVICGAG